MAADGGDKKQLTKGQWEVNAVALSRDGKSFYLTTSEQSPFEQHLYRMPVDGGAREKLTARVGGHTGVLSPDETMVADVFSTSNRPPELFVQPRTRRRRVGAAHDVAEQGVAGVQLDRAGDRDGAGVRRHQGSGAHLSSQGHEGVGATAPP